MSTFEDLVAAACRAETELRALSGDTKMTAASIIDACLKNANSSPGRLNELRRLLESKDDFLRSARAFITQVEKLFTAGRISSGAPGSLMRMASAPSRDDAQAELSASAPGHSLFELWAIAAQNVARKHPEVFGHIQDMGAHKEHIEELKARRGALFERIGREWTSADVAIGALDREGKAFISLRLAPELPIPSLDSFGERLTSHLLRIDPVRWGRAPEAPRSAGDGMTKGAVAPL